MHALDDTSEKILNLRKQIEELTKQAEQFKGTIAEKQKQADTLKRQIDILNSQILQLQIKITITDRQISSAKLEIIDLEGQIFDAGENINKQKQAVGELLSFLYERDKLSLLAVLLKSSRLSDFTNQTRQAEDLNNKLIELLAELKTQKEALEQDKQRLDLKKSELEILNSKQVSQKVALSGNKASKDTLLVQTRGQEAKYQQLLSGVEKKKAEFFAELQKLEAEAVKTGAFIVHVTATSVPPRGSKIFKWPYDDYYLTQSFGMTAYARRGAYGGAPHNGVDLVAGYGTPIRPVASGAILASGFNNGFGNWVAVRHEGNLVTVYAHMRLSSGLANGTPVTADSIIGYEGSTGNATGSHLHLSLYRDFFTYINNKNGQLYFNYFDGSLNPLDYL
ncbi:MAG: peptidoglycan DD-metalloendopeptidase family protein [Candidatus Yanofskybacteria bacterium]|nr:peptidoglycan DD-metalloendopeptidase family protein [Candidatus Yanofskybacteria bacterium]